MDNEEIAYDLVEELFSFLDHHKIEHIADKVHAKQDIYSYVLEYLDEENGYEFPSVYEEVLDIIEGRIVNF